MKLGYKISTSAAPEGETAKKKFDYSWLFLGLLAVAVMVHSGKVISPRGQALSDFIMGAASFFTWLYVGLVILGLTAAFFGLGVMLKIQRDALKAPSPNDIFSQVEDQLTIEKTKQTLQAVAMHNTTIQGWIGMFLPMVLMFGCGFTIRAVILLVFTLAFQVQRFYVANQSRKLAAQEA